MRDEADWIKCESVCCPGEIKKEQTLNYEDILGPGRPHSLHFCEETAQVWSHLFPLTALGVCYSNTETGGQIQDVQRVTYLVCCL